MADMTMGQRIAQRRKLRNLSQEALGEKLGVSRQAISKWEADGAIPEIDKLIAMSKLFGVTVGWLLGTEEEPEKAQPEEFSEAQLKMVEEIVRRYSQPAPKRESRLPAMIIVGMSLVTAAIVGSMFLGSYVNSEINGLNNQIGNLYSYYSSISGQLGDVFDRLEELAQGERLLSEYSFEVEGWQDLTGATVRFTAIPRTTRAGDQAWLSVRRDGQEVTSTMCTMDGGAYTASVELPAANGYSYYFQVVHTGGDSSQQVLTGAYDCANLATGLRGQFHPHFSQTKYNREVMTVTGLGLFFQEPYLMPEGEELSFRELTLLVTYDDGQVLRIPVVRDGVMDPDGTYVKNGWDLMWNQITLDFEFPWEWKAGATAELSVEAVLSNGVTVEQPIMQWIDDGDGPSAVIYALTEK